MNNAISLTHENSQLRAVNEKKKQKWTQSTKQIEHGGGSTAQKGRHVATKAANSPEPVPEPP